MPIGAPVTPGFDDVTNQTLSYGLRIDNARGTLTEVAIDISDPQPLVPGELVTL